MNKSPYFKKLRHRLKDEPGFPALLITLSEFLPEVLAWETEAAIALQQCREPYGDFTLWEICDFHALHGPK